MSILANARDVVSILLSDSVMTQADPQAVAQSLGLTFDGEQDWGIKKFWAFTMREPENPYVGVTFYTPVGVSEEDIRARWQEKMDAFGSGSGLAKPKATFWATSGSGA